MQANDGIEGLIAEAVAAVDRYQASRCPDCKADYGHTILCPLLNRNVAEARSALNGNASESDKVRAHALGITL